ncbi:MAG: hypothetical protein K0R38_7118 [Polyangiaceae bacterium]|nr:hypothetical protein [Polyangiaceae bacterium]
MQALAALVLDRGERVPLKSSSSGTGSSKRLSSPARRVVFETSTKRIEAYRNVANGSELDREPAGSLHLAAFRYAPTGFRFRYRKVWRFKSLFVHSLALWARGALVGT